MRVWVNNSDSATHVYWNWTVKKLDDRWWELGCPLLEQVQFSSVQQLSHVWLFANPWTAACPASLSTTNSRSLLTLMSIELVMPSTISSSVVPFSSHPWAFPASGSFPVSQLFTASGQSIEVSTSASVLPMNIQDWFPLGWTGWIFLQPKGFSRLGILPKFRVLVKKH